MSKPLSYYIANGIFHVEADEPLPHFADKGVYESWLKMAKEEEQLIKDMLPYMQHKEDCLFGREQYLILIGHLNSTTDPKPCTCKMTEVLQRINDRSK